MKKIKILIADDHNVVREGTRQILEKNHDLEIVAEARDGEEAVSLAASSKPDVAIMDIAMPKMDGIEATRQIKNRYPGIAVLILTAYDDDQFIFKILEAGAAGYLLKDIRGSELVDTIRAVNAGEMVLHPAIARKVLRRFSSAASESGIKQPSESLTEREIGILRLAAQGLSNQDMANELFLSLRTIQAHFGHIFNKLQVSSRTEAVVRALKDGWITLDEMP